MNWAHTVNRATHICILVIINNLNIGRAAIAPNEAHAELIIDANTHRPFALRQTLPLERARRRDALRCLHSAVKLESQDEQ